MQCFYSQDRCYDLAWTMTSSIGDLIVANVTQREAMMVVVVEEKGSDADFVRARQRGKNVDALVVEISHGRTVGST